MAISNEHSQTTKTKRFQKPKGREFWINHINSCSQSDLSQAEYCRQHNISKSAFYGWKCKLKAEEHEAQDRSFVAVQIKPPQQIVNPHSDTLDIYLCQRC